MIRISCELGRNIAKYRKRAGMTQSDMAQALTHSTGDNISMHIVSSWQRGLVEIPASVLPDICHIVHCTSFDLYPHSESLTDKDLQLIESIKAMGEDSKDDLFYLLHQWRGDRKALLKLSVLHAVQDESMRYVPDRMIIQSYVHAVHNGSQQIDNRRTVDLEYVKRAFRHLLDDDD